MAEASILIDFNPAFLLVSVLLLKADSALFAA
jgi:hypothetical protein